MILSCQQISLAFGTEVILDKISFHLEPLSALMVPENPRC